MLPGFSGLKYNHLFFFIQPALSQVNKNNSSAANYSRILETLNNEKLTIALDANGVCQLSSQFEQAIANDAFKVNEMVADRGRFLYSQLLFKQIQSFWSARQHLRKNFLKLKFKNKNEQYACSLAFHKYMGFLRFSEENLTLYLGKNNYIRKYSNGFFSKDPVFSHYVGVKAHVFLPGDIIISYGNTFTSAISATIVHQPRSFSHMSFVVEKNGELFVYDFYVTGVSKEKLKDWLKGQAARAAVYRFKKIDFANYFYKEIIKSVDGFEAKYHKSFGYYLNESQVQYDENGDIKGSLFCNGIIPYIMKKFDKYQIRPAIISKLYWKNAISAKNLGITDEYIYQPSDIEVDPEFELMAESVQYQNLNIAHEEQLVSEKIAQQIYLGEYQYQPSVFIVVKTYCLKFYTYFFGQTGDDYANNISTQALESVVELNQHFVSYHKKINNSIGNEMLILSEDEYRRILNEK